MSGYRKIIGTPWLDMNEMPQQLWEYLKLSPSPHSLNPRTPELEDYHKHPALHHISSDDQFRGAMTAYVYTHHRDTP